MDDGESGRTAQDSDGDAGEEEMVQRDSFWFLSM